MYTTNEINAEAWLEELEEFDFKTITRSSVVGDLTIVNSLKNGKRIEIPAATMERMNITDALKIRFANGNLVINAVSAGSDKALTVKGAKGRGTVYNTDAVKLITDRFDLQFANGSVTAHLFNVEYREVNGVTYGLFSSKRPQSQDVAADNQNNSEEWVSDESL